jgi:pentatricopeptide repeat protein
MNLLPVGDGRTYIDLDDLEAEVALPGVTYYKSNKDQVWIRKETGALTSHIATDSEVFKAFMNAGRFEKAKKYFQELFEKGATVTAVTEPVKAPPPDPKIWRLLRIAASAIALLLLGAYIAYIVLVLMGKISASRQVTITNLVVIVVVLIIIAILIRPQVLSNVQEFGVGSLSVKMREQLKDIQNTQKDQGRNLEEIHFILKTLVTTSEMSHLRKLANGRATNYKLSPALVAELRRLRDVGLIESKAKEEGRKQRIGDLPSSRFNLADYVEITPRGNEYINRIREMEAPPSTSTDRDGASG